MDRNVLNDVVNILCGGATPLEALREWDII